MTASSVLLAVDGDSLAHRAYHALPSSIRDGQKRPANALVGFANFLLTLWDSETPDSVVVGWDSLDHPTYRHKLLPVYQSGRVFDDAIVAQLQLLPALTEAFGFVAAKAAGFEADDFLAAAVAQWKGDVRVVTSDRDAFQLVSDRVTVLQPIKGVSLLARIGPAEVRERYGVDPAQVPDFIALRGDSSDRIPGASGVGPKTAAALLKRNGDLEGVIATGRFAPIADDLRLYRHVAQMDPAAPLPELKPLRPDWARAAAFARDLGLAALTKRLEERAA